MNGGYQGPSKWEKTQAELKRADKTIHDFKTALDEHAIVAITDPKGKITYANDKFCAISLYDRQELIGQDHRILNSKYHPKVFIEDLWETIQSGKVWRGEIKNRRKDGTYYWVDTTIVPFLDADENPEQYIAIRADITERKRFEAQLQEVAGQLDKKNQELEAVIHAASHDLRSPLVNVQGFSTVIGDQVGEVSRILSDVAKGKPLDQGLIDEVTEEMAGALKFLQAGAAKMDALLSGLLVISQVGTAEVRITNLNVAQVVDANLAAMKFQIEQADAEILIGDLPDACGDYDLLGRAFTNLFGNALKYASSDRPLRLEVSGKKEGGNVTYRVRDNGLGIAEQHQERIFEIFHRLNPEATDGYGMGLAIVKRALDRMSGTVEVSSEVGQGSVFSMTLPAECHPNIPIGKNRVIRE